MPCLNWAPLFSVTTSSPLPVPMPAGFPGVVAFSKVLLEIVTSSLSSSVNSSEFINLTPSSSIFSSPAPVFTATLVNVMPDLILTLSFHHYTVHSENDYLNMYRYHAFFRL